MTEQRCPKCGSGSMLYDETFDIWLCGRCKSIFTSDMEVVPCDDRDFHRILFLLATERDSLLDELIQSLPNPSMLIPMETEESAGEIQREQEDQEAYANAYQEIYLILQNTEQAYRDKIPKSFMDLIERKRNRGFVSSYDPSKELKDNDLLEQTCGILSHLYIEYWSTPEEAEEYKGILSENQDKVDYMTRMELYRLLDEAEPIDGGLNLEAAATSESFGETCAELCRIMDYLPWEIVEGIYTPEALIHILRHRDYDHYCLMEGRLFRIGEDKKSMTYAGTVDTIRILAGLIRENFADYMRFDDKRREVKRLVAEGEEIRNNTWDRVWLVDSFEKYYEAFEILRSYAREPRWVEDCDLLAHVGSECSEALDYFMEEIDREEYNAAMYGIYQTHPDNGWGYKRVIETMKLVHGRELGCLNSLARKKFMLDVTLKHLETALEQTVVNEYVRGDAETEKQIVAAKELLKTLETHTGDGNSIDG